MVFGRMTPVVAGLGATLFLLAACGDSSEQAAMPASDDPAAVATEAAPAAGVETDQPAGETSEQ